MDELLKEFIRDELVNSLRTARVVCASDISCDSGKASYHLDVAIHNGQFIYGGIAVGSRDGYESVLKQFGIERVYCESASDIDGCVSWAVALQDRYMCSKLDRMVA